MIKNDSVGKNFEKTLKVKRVSEVKISKESRADTPYQGYETIFVILDEENQIYQYSVSNLVNRSLNNTAEILAVLKVGDTIQVSFMAKKVTSNDEKETFKILKINKFIPC